MAKRTIAAGGSRNQRYARLVGGLLNQRGAKLTDLDVNDADMQAAITDFQKSQGIPTTGRADDATLTALRKPVAKIAASGTLASGVGATLKGDAPVGVPATPDEFASFSPAMQANAMKNPNVAAMLRKMQGTEGQTQVDKSAGRSQHNAGDVRANPPAKAAPDFSSSDAYQARPASDGIAPHNQDVTLSRALQAKAADVRDTAIDVTPGVKGYRPAKAAAPTFVDKVLRRRRPQRVATAGTIAGGR